MMGSAGCVIAACFLEACSTGKKRDKEFRNDYFGARYDAGILGKS
jgi:hypothetical protein